MSKNNNFKTSKSNREYNMKYKLFIVFYVYNKPKRVLKSDIMLEKTSYFGS